MGHLIAPNEHTSPALNWSNPSLAPMREPRHVAGALGLRHLARKGERNLAGKLGFPWLRTPRHRSRVVRGRYAITHQQSTFTRDAGTT